MGMSEAGKERNRKEARTLVLEAEDRMARAEMRLNDAAREFIKAEDALKDAERNLRGMAERRSKGR